MSVEYFNAGKEEGEKESLDKIEALEAKNDELERSREFAVKFFTDKCDKLLMAGAGEAELKCIAEKKLKIAVELIEEMLNDSIECRGEEECYHCYYQSILDEKIKAK